MTGVRAEDPYVKIGRSQQLVHGGTLKPNQRIEYATVTTGLRAPRVAVVFQAAWRWDYFARAAMFAAGRTWGGAGFVLVPTTSGEIDPTIRNAVVAYDPDYVVCHQYTMGDLENLTPGTIDQTLDEGNITDEEDRARLRDELRDQVVHDDLLTRARAALVKACSSYRMDSGSASDKSEHRWHERERHLVGVSKAAPGLSLGALTPLDRMHQTPKSDVSGASRELTGDIGVAATMRLGLVHPPSADGLTLDNSQRSAVLRWLFRSAAQFPTTTPNIVYDAAHKSGDKDRLSVWDATTLGLTPIVGGSNHLTRRLCVVGDSPHDFALAMIWDRLYGGGLWVPQSWIGGDDRSLVLQLLRDQLLPFFTGDARKWAITSASCDVETVADIRDEIVRTTTSFYVSDPSTGPASELAVIGLDVELAYSPNGKHHFGIAEQFSSSTTMPVVRESDGSTTLAATPAPPLLDDERLSSVLELSWQVDIDIPDTPMPPSQHVSTSTILHPDESPRSTWVRVARMGLSYEALSYGFVPSGASPDYRLSKPRVRKPGMKSWAKARAAEAGRTAVTSPAGRQGDVLETMVGSRTRLIDVISGDMLPVFRSYIPTSKTTKDQFPNNEGCVVRNTVYLDFPGIVSIAGISEESARTHCDQLLADRLLARGLLLGCAQCENLDFVTIDRLRQDNHCIRCGQANELSHARWKMPTAEPRWFYDLHPVATTLIDQNGEVPVLLAAHLRGKASHVIRYTDCAELDILDQHTKKLAEVDLLALIDDTVVIAEAKSTNELDKGANQKKAAMKRVLLAETFGAHEIILATTQLRWKESSIQAIRNSVLGHDWKAMRRPQVRVVSGLGSDSVDDRYVPLN